MYVRPTGGETTLAGHFKAYLETSQGQSDNLLLLSGLNYLIGQCKKDK